ncbi:MAG: hypothetical protein APR63_08780 [Desulfuromonas sp. SDB]|nr:MAG: hypothetical protein APR63_08780 [Desulfuromonas sp. SDB]
MQFLLMITLLSNLFTSTGDIDFYVVSSRYLDGSGITWDEVYINIPVNQEFSLLEMNLIIENMRGEEKYNDKWPMEIPPKEENYSLIDKFSFDLTDSMEVIILITDPASNLQGSVSYTTSPIEANALLSDVLFTTSVSPSSDSSKFVKNGLLIYPAFLNDVSVNNPQLLAYYEVYPQYDSQTISLNAAILDEENTEIWNYQSEISDQPEGIVIGKLLNLPVGELLNGNYQFIISAGDEIQKSNFKVFWDLTAGEFAPPELVMSPIAEKYYMEIDLIMNVEQQNFFESLSDEGKQAFAKIFWNSRDPNPLTEENEALELFAERIQYADEQYSSGFERGYESDRGRIYIINGKPEEVTIIPADSQYPPNEIWNYWSSGYKYIFADIYQHGEFELIYSNDPDERNHPNYEKYTNPSLGGIW